MVGFEEERGSAADQTDGTPRAGYLLVCDSRVASMDPAMPLMTPRSRDPSSDAKVISVARPRPLRAPGHEQIVTGLEEAADALARQLGVVASSYPLGAAPATLFEEDMRHT